jgi:hypothetical protein
MGLRERIFQRGAEQQSAVPATEPATAGEEPVSDDEVTVIQLRSETQTADPEATDAQPTVVQDAAAVEVAAEPGADEPAGDAQVETGEERAADDDDAATATRPQGAQEGFVVDPGAVDAVPTHPGFRERGRLRRRLRFLREVRELGFRDLGGLVFDQHRFQRPNEALVHGKVFAIDAVDREIRAIEAVLGRQMPYTELFIPGVSACQRCGALHGSDARFCPNCGLAFSGPRSVAGMAPGQSSYGAAGSASPGQAALFDPHTGAQVQASPAPAQRADADAEAQSDRTTGEHQQP